MRILTGIQSSGVPHIGNFFGAIKPAVDMQDDKNENFYFIADMHCMTSFKSAEELHNNQMNAVLDWLALGIDPEQSVFYRQSDVGGIHAEATWYLSCFMGMGHLERAHSFKDKVAKGLDSNVGLFTYPILMASDILLYGAEQIPVGKDQKQHVEMTRDIAQKMNHALGQDFWVLPEPLISEETGIIEGTDGAKMSKSYGNTIEIFGEEKVIKKKIMGIKTESVELGAPLDPDTCQVMKFHKLFGNPEVSVLEKQYREGRIGYGESKKQLFAYVWEYFAEARAKREVLAADLGAVEEILQKGGIRAAEVSGAKLAELRSLLGFRSFG